MLINCILSISFENGQIVINNGVPILLNLAPGILIFCKGLNVFSRENYKIASVLSINFHVTTCNAHTFHINGI